MEYCRDQIKGDCEELLSRFQQTESVRYDIFSNIWKEMKFSDIFCGPMEAFEKRAFSQMVLTTAYSYFLPRYTFQIRVGGLYLLYGLYNSQLCTPKQKIRLPLKDWEDVKKFEHDAANAQHFDAVYILGKLLSQKAFLFTAMPKLLNYQVKKYTQKQTVCEDFLERASRPQELISKDLLEELSNLHEHYEKIKAGISPTHGQPDPSISLIRKDLVPQLRNSVVAHYKWQKQRATDSQEIGDGDSGEGTSTHQECSKRAELLASIKSKSYGQTVEASKSRRHRQVELELTSNEAGPSNETANHRIRKLSLKARTNQNVFLKGALIKETLKATKVWRLSKLETAPEDIPRKIRRFKW